MIQVPLDNLQKTRQYLAEKILNLVQTFYTEERIIRITNDEDPMEPREDMVINEMTPEGTIVNDLTIGEYDVVIGTMPARDSFDEVQFAEALALRQAGVAVPDDAIVQYSHLAKKAELASRLRQEPSEEQMQVMQMQQQLAMQEAQLQVAKLEAEVRKLQSDTAVNIAKTQEMAEIEPQLKMAELQQELQIAQDNLALRRELAGMTNETRQTQAQTSAAAKLATTAMNTAARNGQNS
jgi:hypothetical protein